MNNSRPSLDLISSLKRFFASIDDDAVASQSYEVNSNLIFDTNRIIMVLFGSSKRSDIETLKRNSIAERFEIIEEIGSGGIGYLWKIYKAIDKKTNEDASVFYFDKNHSSKIPSSSQRKNRNSVSQLFKHDVHQLCTYRHARVLNVIEQLKENGDCLAFATEPILGCLANLLPKHEGYKNEPPRDVKDYRFAEVEIRCGILQIAEGISYFHNVIRCLHGALSPENIYITKWGAWKLGGLFFSESFPPNSRNDEMNVKNVKWVTGTSSTVINYQPNMDYLAPELLNRIEWSTGADMFSLGLTICTIYNNGRSLLDTKQRTKDYESQLMSLENHAQNLVGDMGPNLADAVQKMLSVEPKQRPTAQLFTLIKFFDDQSIMCLRQMEDLQYMDTTQKVQFYCSQLKSTLYLIPEELWFTRLLPRLVYDMKKAPDLTSAIVRPLIYMLHHSSPENSSYLQTVTEGIVNGVKPEHNMVIVALLEGIDVIIMNVVDLEEKMIQIVLYSLRHESNNVQDAAVCCLPKLKPFLDCVVITEDIIPSIVYIMQSDVPPYIQCHALESVSQILHLMNDTAASALLDCLICIKTYDVVVISALAKLYAAFLSDGIRMKISANFVASKMLPSFSPILSIENLKESQVTRVLQCLQTMIDYVAKGKLGQWKRQQSVNSSSSDYLLQVPHPQRPQRHSIGGGGVPELTITSPNCDNAMQNSSTSNNHLSTSFPNVQQQRRRKLSGGPNLMLSRLDSTRSQPNSPGQRRHSLQVASRPSSFTNLSHNLVCMLSWKK